MGLSYKVNELPATLREGEFAVVDGVVYVGNSANEPVQVGSSSKRSLLGYREYVAIINGDPTIPTNIEVISDDGLEPDITTLFDGFYRFTFTGEDSEKMVAYSQGATAFDDPSGGGISMIGVLVENNNPIVSITSGNMIIDGSNTTFIQSGSAFLGTTLIVRVYD